MPVSAKDNDEESDWKLELEEGMNDKGMRW